MNEDDLPDPMGGGEERQGTEIVRERAADAQPQDRMASSESISAGGNTAAGGADVQATLHPGSALYRAVVMLFGMGGASLWTWSSASPLDSISAPALVEAAIAFGPAAATMIGAGYLGFHNVRRDAHRLYDPAARTGAEASKAAKDAQKGTQTDYLRPKGKRGSPWACSGMVTGREAAPPRAVEPAATTSCTLSHESRSAPPKCAGKRSASWPEAVDLPQRLEVSCGLHLEHVLVELLLLLAGQAAGAPDGASVADGFPVHKGAVRLVGRGGRPQRSHVVMGVPFARTAAHRDGAEGVVLGRGDVRDLALEAV